MNNGLGKPWSDGEANAQGLDRPIARRAVEPDSSALDRVAYGIILSELNLAESVVCDLSGNCPDQDRIRSDARETSIDPRHALEATDNDVELLQSLIELFLEQLPVSTNEITSGLESSNARNVERCAHSLKGAISVFGKHPAWQAAHDLEQSARDLKWDEAKLAWKVFQGQLASFTIQLRALSAQLKSGRVGA